MHFIMSTQLFWNCFVAFFVKITTILNYKKTSSETKKKYSVNIFLDEEAKQNEKHSERSEKY